MKIGVISDTHGSLRAWEEALAGPLCDVDLILHGGDVLYHGPRNPLPEGYAAADLASAMNRCTIPLLVCKGNCDSEVDQMVLEPSIASPYVFGHFPIGRLLLIHGHQGDESHIEKMAQRMGAEIVVRGHSHVPHLYWQKDVLWLNPGSPSLPKGTVPVPTVAIIDDAGARVLSLVDGKSVMEERWRHVDSHILS